MLLAAYSSLHGPLQSGLFDCVGCGCAIEVALDLDALDAVMRPEDGAEAIDQAVQFRFEHGALSCTCRVPDTHDHLAVLAYSAPEPARRELMSRCISDLRRSGNEIDVDALTAAEAAAIGAALEARDPGAVVSVDVACPACGAAETCFLDPPAFMWRRLVSDAQRLLYEVHTLAAAYGWREADVLALPSRRRRRYLRLTAS
jgi:hypothetical protein